MAESNVLSQWLMSKSIIAIVTAATGLVAAVIVGLLGCSSKQQGVVIYVSEDQVFSEPILRDFERDTGIRVMAVYDTEEAKSTGVMNRLLAEKNNPQADVYWANEPIRAEVLKQQGIAATYRSPSAQGIPANFRGPAGLLDWVLRAGPGVNRQPGDSRQAKIHHQLCRPCLQRPSSDCQSAVRHYHHRDSCGVHTLG